MKMKQPELGRRILELRKQKGFTQEELVDQCNLNVRTIQRIEAGEVTPRSFTLKIILNALGEDLEDLEAKKSSSPLNLNYHGISLSKKYIKIAWLCGIIYFLMGFIEFAIDYARFYENDLIVSRFFYISMKFLVLISYSFFLWGFVLIGKVFNNYLLKIGVYFLLGFGFLFIGYDILSLYFDPFQIKYVLSVQSIFYGIGCFILGFAILRLENPLGKISQIAGGLQIASGVFLLLVFLAWLGLIFSIPTIILQIVLLYKVGEFLKSQFESK